MQYVLTMNVGDGLNDLETISSDLIFVHVILELRKFFFEILDKEYFTPFGQYYIKIYWLFSSSNQ